MFFDTHAHINDNRFDEDRDEVISSMSKFGVDNFCEVGFDIASSRSACDLALKYDFVYAAVGVHPHDCEQMTEQDIETIKNLLLCPKAVAIGEIGLDYYYDNSPRDVQKKWFVRQINLAREVDKPIIVHTRDAMADTLDILKSHGNGDGIIHCYSGSKESAKILLNMGYYIAFGGAITFKNANSILDVVRYVPDDRLLIETDSPYLTPVPNRGKRNFCGYVGLVATKIAELRSTNVEHIAQITTQNAKNVYRIR